MSLFGRSGGGGGGVTENPFETELASISREDFERFKTVGIPILDELSNSLTNPAFSEKLVGDAGEQARVAADPTRTKAQIEREMSRFGRTMDERSKTDLSRGLDLAQSTSIVDAKNRTRQGLETRNEQLQGALIETGQGLSTTGQRSLANAASAQSSNDAIAAQQRSSRRSRSSDMLGTALSAALLFV